jgi:hypothetical protein
MIATPHIPDLDDAASLEAADTPGALRSAATGGAQVRAVAEAVREGALRRLEGLHPRSLVVVAGAGRARRAGQLLAAAFAVRSSLPLVCAPSLPGWVGALDVVLVLGDDAGDPRLADAVDRAVRRGAEVVVAAPEEGPLRAAGAGRSVGVPPRVPVLPVNTLLHHFAVGLAVLHAVDPLHTAEVALDRLAEVLDAEAVVGHPRNEVFHNPAKSLAARLAGHEAVFAGDGPAAAELARHAGEVFVRASGRIVAGVDLEDAVAGAGEFVAATAVAPGYDPLFHDPEIDGPPPRDPVRVFVLSVDPDRRRAQVRVDALPDADLLAVGEAEALVAATEPGFVASPPPAIPAGELEQLAVLALRVEMAAAYVKLTTGGTTPVDGMEAVL